MFDIEFSACVGAIEIFYSNCIQENPRTECQDQFPNSFNYKSKFTPDRVPDKGQYPAYASDLCENEQCLFRQQRAIPNEPLIVHYFGVRAIESNEFNVTNFQLWIKVSPTTTMVPMNSFVQRDEIESSGSLTSGYTLSWDNPVYCRYHQGLKQKSHCLDQVHFLRGMQYSVVLLDQFEESKGHNMLTVCGLWAAKGKLLTALNQTSLQDRKHLKKGMFVNVIARDVTRRSEQVFPIVFSPIQIGDRSPAWGYMIASCVALGLTLFVIALVVSVSCCFRDPIEPFSLARSIRPFNNNHYGSLS